MRTDRRSFLQTGLTAGASVLGAIALAEEASGQNRLTDIGIIGGVPKDMGGDWEKSLRRMAEIGYTQLEGGLHGTSPAEYLAFLKKIGLKLVSCGVKFGQKVPPDALDTAKALHAEYATIFWPWFYSPEKVTLPQLKEIAEQLNRLGEQCKTAGLRLAVHNHDKEFRLLEGKPVFDHLLDLTQPELVAVELDLCWVVNGGADPVDYFKRYPGRFELFHVKDLSPPPAQRPVAAVGSGRIDFARIFAHSKQAAVKYYIVELEGPASTMQAAEDSYKYLRQLKF
jgi:sugar phosphate isomerase/epimerase